MWGRNRKRKSAQKVAKFIKKAEKSRKKAEKCVRKYEKVLKSIEKMHSMSYNYITRTNVDITGGVGMYSATDLAKHIVTKCVLDKHPITNLQLQKILYYIQKDFLKRGKLAFGDNIEAWQFGPVVPNAYYQFSGFGAMTITAKYKMIEDLPDKNRINDIVETKRMLDPWELVEETHIPGGAWAKIYDNGKGNHKVIPTMLIKEEQ